MVQEFTKQLADGIEVKEAIKIVEAQQKKMATFFSLDDVGGLVKGGRVTGAIVKVFKLLKLKPIVQTEVKNHFAGMGKNFEMNTTKILNRIKKLFSAHKLDKSNILHFGVLDGGISAAQIETMKKKAENIFNIDYDLIDVKPVPTCVLCHTRKGSYGYAIEANFEHENSK
jgi:fatty acid-binding protein DegV